jgi:hypothetical protein
LRAIESVDGAPRQTIPDSNYFPQNHIYIDMPERTTHSHRLPTVSIVSWSVTLAALFAIYLASKHAPNWIGNIHRDTWGSMPNLPDVVVTLAVCWAITSVALMAFRRLGIICFAGINAFTGVGGVVWMLRELTKLRYWPTGLLPATLIISVPCIVWSVYLLRKTSLSTSPQGLKECQDVAGQRLATRDNGLRSAEILGASSALAITLLEPVSTFIIQLVFWVLSGGYLWVH